MRLSDDAGMSQLVVSDDGTGFSQTGAQSTGAGLANMRDRMDAVGGTVTVTSRAGSGTTVIALVDSGKA